MDGLAILLAIICVIALLVFGIADALPLVDRFSEADKDLMTRVLWVEAGANSRELQVACGSVMLNQLDCGNYGKTIRDVLTREGAYEGYKKIDRADGQDLAACREVVERFGERFHYFQYFPEEWRDKGWH